MEFALQRKNIQPAGTCSYNSDTQKSKTKNKILTSTAERPYTFTFYQLAAQIPKEIRLNIDELFLRNSF